MHSSPTATTPRGTPSRRGKSPRFVTDSPAQAGSSTLPTDFENNVANTFTSSLDIRVEGTAPIIADSAQGTPPPNTVPQATPPESKRAPRKSKTEALVALNTHARDSSSTPEESSPQDDLTEIYRNSPPIPVAPALDLSSVKTSSVHGNETICTLPRPFGLTDCPEYYPTVEEFKDPMAYIRSISDRAKHYGICKVVPPAEWKMPFVTDTESFRFKTRLQRLNSIEASSRAKLNFLEQLYRFHKQQGNTRVVVPTINHKPLDLWLLRKEVHKLGGYEAVTKGKKWSDLGRILGYRGIPGLSTQIKNSYTRVILPYEDFCNRVRNSPTMAPAARDPHLKTHTNIQSSGNISRLTVSAESARDTSPPSSPLTTSSSPLTEPPDDSEYRDPSGSKPTTVRPRRSTRMGSHDQPMSASKASASSTLLPSPVIPTPVFYDNADVKGTPEQNCEICHKKNRGEEMLLCDGCDCGFHMFCLDPPLDMIPKEQWFCFTCLSGTGGDFGFDEGEEHSLSSFQARDLEFRRMWFESHSPDATSRRVPEHMINTVGNTMVSEFDVENEFWRLVQSPHETVEIEYGADVHSTTHGSAMPTMETHPLDPYAKDPWNLNNIAIVPDSLLRFIKSDISGMTVPWTYVGMAFSTFCWHNEDHYTYSINFMHWGETKTWYGIPGEDAEKFEAAIKCEAPDLFEAQPDLLFQLVTLMNPQRLIDAGVRVFACNQRAGEFVITFPKAYHAGFNHGLNFNEAVNFALPDWLPFGRACVQRYREHRKLPVFSHDELLITITQQSQSIKTAKWLVDSLQEMTDREMHDRQKARSMAIPEILEEEDRPEDQYQCTICKAFCYLSQISCQCSTKVVCVEHADLLCDNRTPNHLTLRKRFSDEDILDTRAKVAERALVPSAWSAKLKTLLCSARPPLRSLRALLAEGDRINYFLPELALLRKCVTKANEWVDSANTFLIRKQSRKRAKRSRGRPSTSEIFVSATDDPNDRPDRGLEDLYSLLKEVEDFGFECPEIASLRSLAQQAEETKIKAAALLDAPRTDDDFLQECKRLLLHGSSLNVLLGELVEVERIVDREQLLRELEETLDGNNVPLTPEEIRQYLVRARGCNLPPENKFIRLLDSKQHLGDKWEQHALDTLDQPVMTIKQLDAFLEKTSNIPISLNILDRIVSAQAKAKDFEKQAKAWLEPEPGSIKPRVEEVLRLVDRAEKDFDIAAISDLKDVAKNAMELENKSRILGGLFAPQDDPFAIMAQWQAYARERLSMFSLPFFEKLDIELKNHKRWIQDLPWYCPGHEVAYGQEILHDVIECSKPEDDFPPPDEYFTCICTTPVRPPLPGSTSDAVQCDHCYARFHGVCAKNGGSCPFCDQHHWNGTIHKQRSWHFCFLPTLLAKAPAVTKAHSEAYKQLEIIVHRVDRLSAVIGQFLAFTSQPANQNPQHIHQVRHYMRKLYRIQFAVSPNPDVSFGLDLAGLHRVLAGRPPLQPRTKKRRRPRFTFGQDVDKDWSDGTRCICRGRTPYLLGYPAVSCEFCSKSYHAGCVFFGTDSTQGDGRYMCPLCCLRKNKTYPFSEVRVKPIDEGIAPDICVDTKEMLETFSKDVIYKKMAPPYRATLFVELVRFQAGYADHVNAPTQRPPVSHHHSPKIITHVGSSSHHRGHPHNSPPTAPLPIPNRPPAGPMDVSSAWSRWSTVTTPAAPPSSHRRQIPDLPRLTPPPVSSRKRKHEEFPGKGDLENMSPPSPKRRAGPPPVATSSSTASPSHTARSASQSYDASYISPPTPSQRAVPVPNGAGPSSRPQQTLSPSLAMIVSPTNQTSPRSGYIRPPLRNGSSGSPSMHAAKLLVTRGN